MRRSSPVADTPHGVKIDYSLLLDIRHRQSPVGVADVDWEEDLLLLEEVDLAGPSGASREDRSEEQSRSE
jgi:hypothetical protein